MAIGMFLFSAVDALAKFLTDSLHPFQIVWIRQLGLVFGTCLLLGMYGLRIFITQLILFCNWDGEFWQQGPPHYSLSRSVRCLWLMPLP